MWLARNVGRWHANKFGSFAVTSVAAYGPGELRTISPGPYILTYGLVAPDQTVDVVVCWDHRITDAAFITKVLIRLEHEQAEAQKAGLQVQLMALEVRRRQALLAAGTLTAFETAPAETIVA